MFPGRYFAATAFARRYWPGVGAPPADDLLAAIKGFFRRQAPLLAITGGVFTDQAGERSRPPYAIVEELGARLALKTSSSTVHDTRIRFKVYAGTLDDAGRYGDLVESAFKGTALSWAGGQASPFVRHDRAHRKDPGRGKGTARVWHLAIEFQTRVRRLS